MNEITCEVCRDLMPLVKDGVASEDSRKAVELHIQTCESCRVLYSEKKELIADVKQSFRILRRKVQVFSAMLMMFGIVFGLGLTVSSEVFYNSLIMPFVGALGYVIFRWSALYIVPLSLLAAHFVINFIDLMRGMEHLDFLSILMMTWIYSIFVVIGFMIAKLLHFAFKKEGD